MTSAATSIQCGTRAVDFDEVWDSGLRSTNPLNFPGYTPPAAVEESVRTGLVRIAGQPAVCIEVHFSRMAGTMGAVAGERITRAYARATRRGLPVVQIVASGGARLQEGMFALIQMARVASAVREHSAAGLLTVAVLRSPTTGGVYASFASLADIRAAEREALIGFGGPRVVAHVTGQAPDAESHSAEAAYRHGLVDTLLDADDVHTWLAGVLGSVPARPLTLPEDRPPWPDPSSVPTGTWAVVQRCREPARPSGLEWAAWLTDSWTELRGADPAIRAGVTSIAGRRTMVIAMDRHACEAGRTLPGPNAFRLARRAIAMADRTSIPVVTIVDTLGADPSPTAETGGIASEIARTLRAMAGARAPSVCLVVGEGGSGGAMALAHADTLVMLEGATFSVISPEAAALVLYRDVQRAPQLAREFHLTASQLVTAGIADRWVAEELGAVRHAVSAALRDGQVGDRDRRLAGASRVAVSDHARTSWV